MPKGRAVSTIVFVMSMSAREGVGSPEGWLWTSILEVQIPFIGNALAIFKSQKGYLFGVGSLCAIVIHPNEHEEAYTILGNHAESRISNRYQASSYSICVR
jgi:hypothetical protein